MKELSFVSRALYFPTKLLKPKHRFTNKYCVKLERLFNARFHDFRSANVAQLRNGGRLNSNIFGYYASVSFSETPNHRLN